MAQLSYLKQSILVTTIASALFAFSSALESTLRGIQENAHTGVFPPYNPSPSPHHNGTVSGNIAIPLGICGGLILGCATLCALVISCCNRAPSTASSRTATVVQGSDDALAARTVPLLLVAGQPN